MQAPTERQVFDWLTNLARLVASNMTPQEAGERLRAYTPELLARFDSSDFNASSREFVARNCKFFPSYGELCGLLDKWPRPVPERSGTVVGNDDLSPDDCAWIEFFRKRRADLFAQTSGFKWGDRERDLANLASLVRGHSLRAWAHVTGEPMPVPRERTEAELSYVANLLRPMPVVPKSQMPEPPPLPPRPKPNLPSERDLRIMREARGCIIPESDFAP